MFKAMWAVGTAALVAAAITFFPILTPEVEASTPVGQTAPAPVAQTAPAAPVVQPAPETSAAACERAWPYYAADCLRSPGTRAPARIVSTDRVVPR